MTNAEIIAKRYIDIAALIHQHVPDFDMNDIALGVICECCGELYLLRATDFSGWFLNPSDDMEGRGDICPGCLVASR